jgi:hypothetical protein
MNQEEGAASLLRAGFDVKGVPADAFVGPVYFAVGEARVQGTSLYSLGNQVLGAYEEEDAEKLWKYSMDSYKIESFGN